MSRKKYLNLAEGFEATKMASPQKAQAFYESVKAIKNDKNMQMFMIAAKPRTVVKPCTARPHTIYFDKQTVENSGNIGVDVWDGEQCMASVTNFAKKYFGKDVLEKVMPKETWL